MLLQQIGVGVAPGQEAAFESALLEVRDRLVRCVGFRGFSVAQNAETPTDYLVHIRWETAEELTQCVESGRFARAWAPVDAHRVGPLRAEHLVERPTLGFHGVGVLTDLGWASGGEE
jgi:heme-degrading monooxygenase HmoA